MHADDATFLQSNINASTHDARPAVKLDPPPHAEQARKELLREADFLAWQRSPGANLDDDPQEMQKQDPLGTQIWKLFKNTKSQLPNQERMENLSWRMMAMNLRRREQAAR
jgi:GATA-binding protein